jgi:26S proteasome regulatory subunit N5
MMIQQAMTYIEASPADSKYLDSLREISEGKIYLEVEFARITKIVAKRLESEGDVMNASSILQEV